jgi:hypothetical protein
VTPGIDLNSLSHAEKDELILSLLPLVGRLEAALARIAELERRLARFERPAKTPDNSSLPPSKGQKPDRGAGDKPPRKSRPGVGRTLHPNPDRVVDARLTACPNCQAAFPEATQTPQQVYERIELPPIKPDVTQVRLFGGRCACCGERVTATAPAGLEPGSPFGQSIAVLVVYLHYAHPRHFRRDQIIYDPWHYLPVLVKKPGALRNGAPFKDWDLPPALAQVRAKLKSHPDGDRQFVKVLGAVLDHGLAAVEAACAEALAAGIASGDVILTVLARQRQPATPPSITTPDALRLRIEPMADCGRYDSIRKVA